MLVTIGEVRAITADETRVEDLHLLSDEIGKLYQSTEYSDVTLHLQGQSIPAHKMILASRAEYFRALFFGGFREASTNSIKLDPDTPLTAFMMVLRYIYTGKISLDSISEDKILELLLLSNKYQLTSLEQSTQEYLINSVSCENVSKIIEFNNVYSNEEINLACFNVIDADPTSVLEELNFTSISAESFKEIISRDSFSPNEKDVFLAAQEWIDTNYNTTEEERNLVLSTIRLHHIPRNVLLKEIWYSKLFPSDTILKVLEDQEDDILPPKRAALPPPEALYCAMCKYNTCRKQNLIDHFRNIHRKRKA